MQSDLEMESRWQDYDNYDNINVNGETKDIKMTTVTPGWEQATQQLPKAQKHESAAPDLIGTHGYEAESHFPETTDGYKITVHRIIPKSRKEHKDKRKRVVLLHHGLLGSSSDWLLLGPGKALPYILTDRGYDVWLTNARGNRYSRVSQNTTEDSMEYWNFSWYEMGIYDLPAVIKYILHVTGEVPIDFIGHSMGGTALLVLLSTRHRYNEKLRSATLLAPLAFMSNATGPLRALAQFYSKNGFDSLNFLGEKDFLNSKIFPRAFRSKYCKGDEDLCLNPLLFIANGGQKIRNKQHKQNILKNGHGGGSTKTILHYCQLITSGQFVMFDLGPDGNFKAYGDTLPPTFNYKHITVPISIFTSVNDWLCSDAGIKILWSHISKQLIHYIVRKDGFSHTDFAWGEQAPYLVYNVIIELLDHLDSIL